MTVDRSMEFRIAGNSPGPPNPIDEPFINFSGNKTLPLIVIGLIRSLSEYSKQIVLHWIPRHCGVTVNEFADHLAKKRASIQQVTRKAISFTSARRIIKKKLNDLSSRRYAGRNSNKIWWKNFKDLPMWLKRKAVAEFHLTNGHDCFLKHLHKIHVTQACALCDFREDMDADRICRCPDLKGSFLYDLYWQTRNLFGS
ncbi:hypothetical protein TNCV_4292101 [Trichonephila clavipes]|uniref:RNase H type-1 domain-containing protein n=1 Tax=Trichonephila clavipes TaxID=2585209 RepID=A0A8X6RHD1_TRICX|nr:hypothetical protein TNCV_4292101 [Trichonephila clavipes]